LRSWGKQRKILSQDNQCENQNSNQSGKFPECNSEGLLLEWNDPDPLGKKLVSREGVNVLSKETFLPLTGNLTLFGETVT
jgi:hypothetical protein